MENQKSIPQKVARIILLAAAGLAVLIAVMTCFYTVDDKQQAVVTTLGRVADITDPGLHFKLPFGIQQGKRWM